MKKKKIEEMTEEEAREELERLATRLEKLQPKLEGKLSNIVGKWFELARLFYRISKDERKKKQLIELWVTDKNFRRDFFEMAEGLETLETELWKTDDLGRQLEELVKKQKEKKKD